MKNLYTSSEIGMVVKKEEEGCPFQASPKEARRPGGRAREPAVWADRRRSEAEPAAKTARESAAFVGGEVSGRFSAVRMERAREGDAMATIVVTGRSEKITSRDRQHAEDKIQKLEKYFNGITRIEFILQKTAELAEVELILSIRRGSQIVCRAKDKDLYAAIDLVLDKAEIQLTRHKEKVRDRRGAHEEVGAPIGEESAEEKLEAYEDIVEKREFEAGGTGEGLSG
jgi:putative sigma-54 modulation protein